MRRWFALIIIISITDSEIGSATAQANERILYEKKMEKLMSVPLQSLHDKAESLGINLPDFHRYFSDDGMLRYSTGNWRGYVGLWEIEDDTLYLREIRDSEREKKANLKEIFGDYLIDNRVKAFWYTGDLRIPKGDLISYVHMGFESVFEKEIVIEIENGIVTNITEYENRVTDPPLGFQNIMTRNLRAVVPLSLSQCQDFASDTICFRDDEGKVAITGSAIHDPTNRFDRNAQMSFVSNCIDSLAELMSVRADFNSATFEKQRSGYVGWIDGKAKDNSGLLRVLVMSNFFSRLFIQITFKETDRERFDRICDVFSHSLMLTEFGH